MVRLPSADPAATGVADARAVAVRVQSLIDGGALDAAVALGRDALPGTDGEVRAILQHALAVALNVSGHAVDALRAAAASREGFRQAGRLDGELDALLAIGGILRAAGDHATAIETFEEAETIARDLSDASRIGIALRQIGICCSLIGRHQQALSSLAEAADLHADDGGSREHLSTRLSLYNARNRWANALPAGSAERDGELRRYLALWTALAADAATAGLTRIELMALGNHAITLHDVGSHREALAALAALLPRYRDHGMAPNEAICHFEMGRACESLGDRAEARSHYREAVERFERNGASGELRDALEGLANVDEALDDHRGALAALRRVRAIEAALDEAAAHRHASQRELRIELARLSSHWHRLASIDPLTGLANRRALEQWFADAKPRIDVGEPVMVLLHDLDHFKSINDGFGHPVGDEVLRQVARLIQANCRPGDLAVRYGGEEFLVAMPGIERDRAVEVAERLRQSIERHPWDAIVRGLVVTVSIGVAALAEAGDAPALLTLADRRLYAAKHGGRNRVVAVG